MDRADTHSTAERLPQLAPGAGAALCLLAAAAWGVVHPVLALALAPALLLMLDAVLATASALVSAAVAAAQGSRGAPGRSQIRPAPAAEAATRVAAASPSR